MTEENTDNTDMDMVQEYLADERQDLPEIFEDWYNVATDDVTLSVAEDPKDPRSAREKIKTGRHMIGEYLWHQLLRQELMTRGYAEVTQEMLEKVTKDAKEMHEAVLREVADQGEASRTVVAEMLQEHDEREYQRHAQLVNQGWWAFGAALGGAVLALAGLVGIGTLLSRSNSREQELSYDPDSDPLLHKMNDRFDALSEEIDVLTRKFDDSVRRPEEVVAPAPASPQPAPPQPQYVMQPVMQQPVMQQPVMQQPMMAQPVMQPVMVQQPVVADDYEDDEDLSSMALH